MEDEVVLTPLQRVDTLSQALSALLKTKNLNDAASEEAAATQAVEKHLDAVSAVGTVEMSEFPGDLDWFNTSRSIKLRHDLKGKITVLDFWTFCCINCIHLLPELAELEHEWKDHPVAFVGVHSAKFNHEKESENIRQAVLRYDIEHPVVNDLRTEVWNAMDIHCWPTLLLLDPSNKPIAIFTGEGHKPAVSFFIKVALQRYRQQGLLSDHPLPIQFEKQKTHDASTLSAPSFLRFPGKLAMDDEGNRLFISDSNNHRIVVTDLQGRFIEAIGEGQPGLKDGDFQHARFNRLQGLAFHRTPEGERIYVADAENNALRLVDLKSRTVSTLAGNGKQGTDKKGGKGGAEQEISTPWDVTIGPDGDCVFIAMSGTHQIWRFGMKEGIVENYSGDGEEMNRNNSNRLRASWAQPSGISVGREVDEIFIADSESSSIRAIHLKTGKTRTIAGGERDPKNLFAFGDAEGKGVAARLQHPLGVCWLPGLRRVAVADTYNHRLKLLDPATGELRNWIGSGRPGSKDGVGLEAELYEPAGFCATADGTTLFVGDANNHRVRVVDIAAASIRTFELSNLPTPKAAQQAATVKRLIAPSMAHRVSIGPVNIPQGGRGILRFRVSELLPAHFHFTPGAPSKWQLIPAVAPEQSRFNGLHLQNGLVDKETRQDVVVHFGAKVSLASTSSEGSTSSPYVEKVEFESNIYFCSDDEGICLAEGVLFDISLAIAGAATSSAEEASPVEVVLTHKFSPPAE